MAGQISSCCVAPILIQQSRILGIITLLDGVSGVFDCVGAVTVVGILPAGCGWSYLFLQTLFYHQLLCWYIVVLIMFQRFTVILFGSAAVLLLGCNCAYSLGDGI